MGKRNERKGWEIDWEGGERKRRTEDRWEGDEEEGGIRKSIGKERKERERNG